MRKISFLFLLSLIIQLSFVAPALAVPSWECTFDLAGQLAGWAIGTQSGGATPFGAQTGSGIEDTEARSPAASGAWFRRVDLYSTIASTTITRMQVKFDYTFGTSNAGTGATPFFMFGKGAQDAGNFFYVLDRDDMSTESGSNVIKEWTGSTTVTQFYVSINSDVRSANSGYTGAVLVKEIIVEGNGSLPSAYATPTAGMTCTTSGIYFKPVASGDFDAWGMVEKQNTLSEPQDHAIFAYSSGSGLPVYSAVDGTITSVRRAAPGDCDSDFGRGTAAGGGIFTTRCTYNPPGDIARAIDGAIDGGSDFSYVNAWIVTLFDPTDSRQITYWVDKADLYVSEGQTVEGGCLIGKTMRIDANELPSRYLDQGAAILNVKESGTIVDAIDDFTLEPDPAAPCNQDEELEECLGDVQLRDSTAWETSADVVHLNPGFGFGAGEEYISTTMNLDGVQEPELIVRAKRWVGSDGKLELTLGQTTTIQTLSSPFNESGTVSIAGGAHEPDGAFYTIRIKNLSGGYIDIESVCVRFTADEGGDPIPDLPDLEDPPGEEQQACIFADNSFNNGTGGWSVSGSVEGATGEIRVPHNQTWSQPVDVTAGSYTINVVAAVWHYSSYTPDDEDTTGDITISYDYPADGSYTTIDAKTFGEFAQGNNLVTYQVAYNPGSDQSGTFSFQATISSPPTGVRGVAIKAVCIDDGDYGDGEGDGGDGQGGGDDLPFEANCAPISQPSGTSDIGVWVSWLWAKLNGFYRCELIILLNDMYKLMRDAWLTTSWSIRWSQEATRLCTEWFAEDWTFWLGGHLANIVNGNTVVITAPEGDCNNLFCVLDRLLQGLLEPLQQLVDLFISIIEQATTLLFGLISLILTILGEILQLIFELFGVARDLLVSLLDAWVNSTPTSLPNVPSCATDPQGNALCIGIWVLDNTVFSGTGGAIIPIVVGILCAHLLIWCVEQIRSMVLATVSQS